MGFTTALLEFINSVFEEQIALQKLILENLIPVGIAIISFKDKWNLSKLPLCYPATVPWKQYNAHFWKIS